MFLKEEKNAAKFVNIGNKSVPLVACYVQAICTKKRKKWRKKCLCAAAFDEGKGSTSEDFNVGLKMEDMEYLIFSYAFLGISNIEKLQIVFF